MLNPLLYSLFTHDCMATHTSNSIIKFADNTTVVGLITNNDETVYREKVRALGMWCLENHLSPKVKNKGADHGLQEIAEGAPPSKLMGPQWRRWRASSSSAYTSLTN